MDISSQHVLGHLLCVLDDEEQQQVEMRLERNPAYCQSLEEWHRQLALLETLRSDYQPPAGLAERTCRFVAAQKAAIASRRSGMAPVLGPPNWSGPTRWLDVCTIVLLFVAAATVLFPALYQSRFHARLAACQNGLREFGSTLAQYGQQHGNPLERWAGGGQLRAADVLAHNLMQVGSLAGLHRVSDSDAWLPVERLMRTGAAQAHALPAVAVPTRTLLARSTHDDRFASRRTVCVSSPMLRDAANTAGAGIDNDSEVLSEPMRAALGLPPDASDAFACLTNWQGGRAWNVLFEDGHVDLLPRAPESQIAAMFFADAVSSPAHDDP